MKNPVKAFSNVWKTWRHKRKEPLRLEFNVTDTCNLNCVGCTHYSPLAPRTYEPIETLCHSIRALGRSCSADIKIAYLIGGETLLYPHLTEAMEALREAFPDARLHIFTNGLLIPKMTDDFWQTCRRLDFILSITRYPIRFDYDAAEELCKSKGVAYEIFGDRSLADSFFRFALDPSKSQNRRRSHFKCYNSDCITVIGDRVFPCSISACIGHLNKAHATRFEHVEGDFINVADVKSARDIKRLRDKAAPFCAYCIQPPATVTYRQSERKVTEWVEQ